MADLGSYSDKLIDDQQNPQAQTGPQPQASGQLIANGTSGVVGSAQDSVSTAGVGAGGTGGWTNIQSYLNANQADNGSSGLLQQKVGGDYDKEYSNLTNSANDTMSQAKAQADGVANAKDNSKQWVDNAANAYSWTGNQNQDYLSNVGKLKNALTGQYAGPNNFAYTTSADFQKNQSALGDDNSFNNYMNDIYKQKAGGQLNQGQGALQTQLDVNNQGLADARANLLKKYAGFGDEVGKVTTDTDNAIKDYRTQYGNNQSALADTLQGYANDNQAAQTKAEADARAAYDNAYNSGSGRASAFNSDFTGEDPYVGNTNLTWNQIRQQEINNQGWKDQYYNPSRGLSPEVTRMDKYFPGIRDKADANTAALNNFYNEQTNKYKDTGDSEKKHWNTIEDILNQSGRKNQGFNVRG